MINLLHAYTNEQNANWLRSQSRCTAANNPGRVEANNVMNIKAQEEQEKLYTKKNKPMKPLLFDYYKTLYKSQTNSL